MNENLNDNFFVLKWHFFRIEKIEEIESFVYEITLENKATRITVKSECCDIVYNQLQLDKLSFTKESNTYHSFIGKTIKVSFGKKKDGIKILTIQYYDPFNKDDFQDQYNEVLNFSINNILWFLQGLSRNEGLRSDIIECLKMSNRIDYRSLLLLNKFLTKEKLLEKAEIIKYNEKYLAQNESILWDQEVLDLISSSLCIDSYLNDDEENDLCMVLDLLSVNKKLIQNEMLIADNSYLFNWTLISESRVTIWNKKYIYILKDKLCWKNLSSNPSLPWDKDLIRTFKDNWDWLRLSKNTGINWNTDLINEFYPRTDLSFFSFNHMNLTSDLIMANDNKWDWNLLSSKIDIPWSSELIELFKNKWDWNALYMNEGIEWDKNHLPKMRDKYAWHLLSNNKGNFWTRDIIIENYFVLDLESLARNTGLPWSVGIFKLLKNRNELKNQHQKLFGKSFTSEEEDIRSYDNRDSEYFVDPDTDIVFLQGSPSIDQIIASHMAEEDREEERYCYNDPNYEDIIKENPLLNRIIWDKMYGCFLSDYFVYDVLVRFIPFHKVEFAE